MAASAAATRNVAVLAAALLVSAVAATDYVVGPTGEWTFIVNYTQWASSTTFKIGDNLIFKYGPTLHDVVEVEKGDYDACTAKSPIGRHTDGNTTIMLTVAGTRYFICSLIGHCQEGGMKVEITVPGGTSTPSAGPAQPPASPSEGSTPGPASPKSSPSGSSAATTLNAAAAITLGAAMVFVAL